VNAAFPAFKWQKMPVFAFPKAMGAPKKVQIATSYAVPNRFSPDEFL
jgi:hypothetical protein